LLFQRDERRLQRTIEVAERIAYCPFDHQGLKGTAACGFLHMDGGFFTARWKRAAATSSATCIRSCHLAQRQSTPFAGMPIAVAQSVEGHNIAFVARGWIDAMQWQHFSILEVRHTTASCDVELLFKFDPVLRVIEQVFR
jgi:hypothetical protein